VTAHSETSCGGKRTGAKYALMVGAFLCFVLVQSSTVRANTLTFSAGNFTQTSLLNDGSQGTDFDILSLTGLSGSSGITVGGPAVVEAISAVTFTDGPSCEAVAGCDAVSIQTGIAAFSLTVDGGVPETLDVPFQACLTAGGYAISPVCTSNPTDDTVQLFSSAPLSFAVAPNLDVIVQSLGVGPIVGSSSGTTEDLTASFTLVATPEPSSLLLLGAGLLSVLLFAKKWTLLAGSK
jgi:hypothetical protein